jgi:hypothetical protein
MGPRSCLKITAYNMNINLLQLEKKNAGRVLSNNFTLPHGLSNKISPAIKSVPERRLDVS